MSIRYSQNKLDNQHSLNTEDNLYTGNTLNSQNNMAYT
jgi:hypothetical protein